MVSKKIQEAVMDLITLKINSPPSPKKDEEKSRHFEEEEEEEDQVPCFPTYQY